MLRLGLTLCFSFMAMGQNPPNPGEKAIQLRNTQHALNTFTNLWNKSPLPMWEMPKLITTITDNAPIGESLNPFFMSGFNENQIRSVLNYWPFSDQYRQKVIDNFAKCSYMSGDEVHYDPATKTATYIRIVFIKEGPSTLKYVALKSHYQMTFDTVKNQQALDRLICYMESSCKAVDQAEKTELLNYMKNKANGEFASSQTPTRVSVEKSLEVYQRYLPQDYQVPELCKLPEIDVTVSEVCNYQDPLLNQVAGVMQSFRFDQQISGPMPEGQIEAFLQTNICDIDRQEFEMQLQAMIESGVISVQLKEALAKAVLARVVQDPKNPVMLPYAVRETYMLHPTNEKRLNYARIAVLVKNDQKKMSMLKLFGHIVVNDPIEVEKKKNDDEECKDVNVVCKDTAMPEALQPTNQQTKVIFEALMHKSLENLAEGWKKVTHVNW